MTTRRAPPLLAIFGAVLLRLGGSDRLLFYVRPSTRPYVVAAGAVLLVVGLAGWLGAPSRRCSRTPWAGWLILVPVLAVAAVVPPPQGVLVGSPRDGPPSRSDDATEALRGTDPVTLKLSEFVVRATWAPATLRGRVLRVLGFVAGRRSGAFTLARLSITCCAADAQRDDIEARLGDGVRAPPAGTWVQVTGRFTGMSRRNRFVPVLA
ncbi:MAG TPA: TIGR03943 family protein, partial [Jatrophihabitans sp.]|nr:TIGR03943 family protein [Jatrophihabitans sp.]